MNAKRLFTHRLALPMAVVAIILIAAAGAGAAEPQPQGPVTTSFTYQGRLTTEGGGDPIDDSCDFRFTLWDDPDAGSQVGPLLNPTGVPVADGLFTVQLDFGQVFDGTALWLEVAVQCSGDPGYTTLSPRPALTAAPYATYAVDAQDADTVDGSHASAFAPAVHNHWGESWTGTGIGLTLSGGTTGLSGNGGTYGVVGQSNSVGGCGLYGLASAATGTNNYGVYGLAQATDGSAVGIYGRSESIQGRGVFGYTPSTSGTTYGVYGRSESSGGTGVFGYTPSTSGNTYGVVGRSDSPSGYGGWFQASSSSGVGVMGFAPVADAGSTGIAVKGESHSPDGYGGWFASYSTSATTTQAGLFGLNDSNEGYGVVGYNRHNGTGLGVWSKTGRLIQAFAGDYPAADWWDNLRFYVTNDGAAYAWSWHTVIPMSETGNSGNAEYRTLYAMMGAEAWAEDFGSATLQEGKATVTIEPVFAQTVNLAVEYHVYLTPLCSELIVMAVTGKGPDSFTVQGATLDGKPSGCAFDYRIVAKQRGHEDERLEQVDISEPVAVDREQSRAPGAAGPEPEGAR